MTQSNQAKKASSPIKKVKKKETEGQKGSKKRKEKTERASEKEEAELLTKAKKSLEKITLALTATSKRLPSLVSVRDTTPPSFDTLHHERFKTDYELISMLEEFFTKLVLLLRFRSAFDEKLSQISRIIANLEGASSLKEFRGNMQLLGIALQDAEQIVRNYEQMYNKLFTEQALLQFQLMEQLALFREKDIPNYSEIFSESVKTFHELNLKLLKNSER